MRNLIKKSLAFLLVAALALTCFVGTLTVSAEDATTPTATIVIKVDDVEAGAKQIPVTFTVTSTLGINEALIKVSSNLGDIIAQPTVVADCPADIDNAGNATDYNAFYLSAKSPEGQPETVMGEIKTATISAVFVNEAGLVAGETYTVDVEIPEGKVIAASKDEVAIKLECTKYEFTVEEVAACDHANAVLTFNSKTDTAFVYDYTCECGESGQKTFNIGTDYTGSVATKKVISPTNDIAMTFRFATAGITDYTNLIAVISKQKYAKNATESTFEEHYITEVDTSNSGNYSFKFSDIAAYEMNNSITCTLYGMNADEEMIKLGAVENYSVCDYVTGTLETYASNTSANIVNLKKALVDLLIYGAKAQTLGYFNTANLASSVLTEEQLSLGTPASEYCTAGSAWNTLPEAKGDLEGSNAANKITVTKTLNPAEKVYVQFTLKTHAADINNYSVKFNYYDTKGNAKETDILSFAEAGFTKYKTDGSINSQGFEFALAPITTFDYPITATIYCDGVAIHEVIYSIEAYIKAYCSYAGNSNAALNNLGQFVQSMYAYGRSMATAAKVTSYADFIA
jgi:hypothetical protein